MSPKFAGRLGFASLAMKEMAPLFKVACTISFSSLGDFAIFASPKVCIVSSPPSTEW